MSLPINKHVAAITLFLVASCIITACTASSPWVVVLTPTKIGEARTQYVKVSGVWNPAQYFPHPPPTQSPEKWGLMANCRPAVKVSNSVTDGSVELPASQPPSATLIFNPRNVLTAAIQRIRDESSDKKSDCVHSFQVENLSINWDMGPSGMGYWGGEFEVRIELSLIGNAGQVESAQASSVKLLGLISSSTEEQARLTSIAGNDAVYGALVEGIDDLLSGPDR